MKHIILSCSALLLLGACVTQEQADARMAHCCEAGVKSLLKDNDEIQEIKNTAFADEDTIEGPHRRITLATVTNDGWHARNANYSCLFAQQWGLFKSSHVPLLVQIKLEDGTIIGKDGGFIKGDIETFTRLNETVDRAMAQ